MNIKDILYLLATKKYYLDNQKEVLLEDGYTLKIELIDDYAWANNANAIQPLCKLSLIVSVTNQSEYYQMIYKKSTFRNLNLLLNASDEEKIKFILRKRKGIFQKTYKEEKNKEVYKMSMEMKKAVLKTVSKELNEFYYLIDGEQKKLQKVIKGEI